MKERGIIFTDTVPALLAGTKTQTRRLVGLDTLHKSTTAGYDWTWRGQAPIRSLAQQRRHPGGCWQDVSNSKLLALCPYGAPGDRIWVRETWQAWRQTNVENDEWEVESDPDLLRHGRIEYKATSESVGPWRSPIFMPRWASRILLELTDVRVQRLHEITEEDARAEGVVPGRIPADEYGPERIGYVLGKDDGRCTLYPTERSAFAAGWEGIHGSDSWVSNPWVWALTFKRAEATP